MMRLIARILLLACTWLAACKESEPGTQVMVVIDAESSVRDRVSDVDVVVKSGTGDVSTWSPRYQMRLTQGSGDVPWPLELALVPRDGDTSRNYLVVATAWGQSGSVLAEVRAISGYIEGRSLSLPLVFDAACVGQMDRCNDTQTCRAGDCADAYVEPSTLLPFEPGQRPGDDVMTSGGSGGYSGGGGSGVGGDGDGDGDAAVSNGGDGAVDECVADPEACEPDPMIMCDDERCAGCPTNFLRLPDDSCAPLLIGLEISKGELAPALSTDDVDYEVAVPLLTDAVTFRPLVPDGVTIEAEGEDLEGSSFTARNLPLGVSMHTMTLRASGHSSRTYTFELTRSGGQRTFIKAHNTGADDNFGHAVAMQGNTIVIGAPNEDSSSRSKDADNNARANAGAAYVMASEGATYQQVAYLKADPILEGAHLGTAVAIDGDRIVVGAPDEPAGGSAYVFRREGTDYVFEARLTVSPSLEERRLGAAVAIQGDTIAVGAPGDNRFTTRCGAVYVFTRDGTAWTSEDPVGPATPTPYVFFGSSVLLDGDALYTGATGESNDVLPRGALYVFERQSGQYVEQQRIAESDAGPFDFFGETVAVEGDTLVIGAFGGSSAVSTSGLLYTYARSAGGWERTQKLVAGNPSSDGWFGVRVALHEGVIVTGASQEDSGASGINGELSEAARENSGAGYMFTRSGSTWSQIARIKAEPPEPGDRYGFSVAAVGDTIVFGAPGESSSATDVDGDATINGATGSGAVYVVR